MGKYSTYKGRLELLTDLPEQVRNGWRPPSISPTQFGEQVVCTALYWLSKNVTETSKNYGQYIDLFKKDYYGSVDDNIKQSAYCTVFAWFVINEAAKTVDCSHKFPGKKHWGNAKNTFEDSKNFYKVDYAPRVGAMMFRKSTDSSSSGHYGIIVNVDRKNRTFDTVEGNVKMTDNGSKEGVAAWRYRFDDLKASNGMQIIHVEEEETCKSVKNVTYKGFECRPKKETATTGPTENKLPKCVKKDVNGDLMLVNESGQGVTRVYESNGKYYFIDKTGWVEIKDCTEWPNLSIPVKKETKAKQQKPQYSPTKDKTTPPEEKVKICKNTIVKIPQQSQLQHYSVLQENKVIADIIGANIGSSASRNGSALWYNGSEVNTGKETGFGMFKDKVGNLIYVLDGDSQESQTIMKDGMLGKGIYDNNTFTSKANTLIINKRAGYYNGGGWKERFIRDLSNRKFKFGEAGNYDDIHNGALVFMPKISNLNNVVNYRNVPGRNLFGYLTEIENREIKLESPIVIYITERGSAPSLTRKLDRFLSVVGTLSNLVGIPIPPKIMDGAEALLAVADGRANISNITNLAGNLTQMAEFFAPEIVKDANNTIGNLRKDVGSYLKEAESVFKNVINDAKYNLSPSGLKGLESQLGLDKLEISKLLSRYSNYNSKFTPPDMTKILKGFNLSDVSKVVDNATNVFMLDTVRRSLGSGQLQQDVIRESNPIRNIPVLQDLFIAGGSNSALRMFPEIENFTSGLLNNYSVQSIISKSENPNEIIAGLIGNNFGNIPKDKGVMKALQIEGLIGKALQTDITQPFALPNSIEEEYKECYKFIIEQESDREVLWCPDGWEWDHDLRKCVNKTVQSSGFNPGGSITNNGNIATGKKIEYKNTDASGGSSSGGYIPNDWTYTGYVPDKIIAPDNTTPGEYVLPEIAKKIITPTDPIYTPPVKEKLPPCVVFENGAYYYYTDKSKRPLETVYEVAPEPTEVRLPKVDNKQIIRTEIKPTDIVSLPGGVVTTPPNASDFGYRTDPMPLPNGLFNNTAQPFTVSKISPNSGFSLPTGLNDKALPDKIRVYRKNANTPQEEWYVRIDGRVYSFDPVTCQILGYNPTEKKKIVVPEKIVTPPDNSKQAEKLIEKMKEEREELEAQLEIERARRKVIVDDKPDERVIALEKRLEQEKLANQQKEAMLLKEIQKISNAKPETSPELLAQLERSRNEIATLTKLVNEKNTPAPNNDDEFRKEISLLKKELELEKNRKIEIEKATPQVQKAVEECTDCDLAKTPSRVVSITEYGGYRKNKDCNQCNDCSECDCGECN